MAGKLRQDNKDAVLEKCLKQISELSPEWQKAFAWLINNFEVAIDICESSTLTAAEIASLRHKAIETGDTMLELLLILKGVLDIQKHR